MTNNVRLDKSVSNWPKSILVKRALWEIVYLFFWPNKFRFLSPVRVALLRLFGAKIGSPNLVMDRVRVWMPWNLRVGACSTLGSGVEIYNFGFVEIGDHTVLSQRVYICTASHEYSDPTMPLTWDSVSIGSGCWIAAESFIGKGVVIGAGAVVGARSVVTRDVEPWTVAAGNPARPIKNRSLFNSLSSEKN